MAVAHSDIVQRILGDTENGGRHRDLLSVPASRSHEPVLFGASGARPSRPACPKSVRLWCERLTPDGLCSVSPAVLRVSQDQLYEAGMLTAVNAFSVASLNPANASLTAGSSLTRADRTAG